MQFIKMQAIGNDFIVIEQSQITSQVSKSQLASNLCHRKFGIGADQCLFIYWQTPKTIIGQIYNSDGSLALSCGNAMRCLGLLNLHTNQQTTTDIWLQDKKFTCNWLYSNVFEVNMGQAQAWQQDNNLANWQELLGTQLEAAYKVIIGNSHLVLIGNSPLRDPQSQLSKIYNYQQHIDEPANIHYIYPTQDGLNMTCFEKGSGLTLACGSGACASSYAYNLFTNNSSLSQQVTMPGGSLTISSKNGQIYMKGEANLIFEGNWYDKST